MVLSHCLIPVEGEVPISGPFIRIYLAVKYFCTCIPSGCGGLAEDAMIGALGHNSAL